jgi:hypothetical protein
VGKKEKKKDY